MSLKNNFEKAGLAALVSGAMGVNGNMNAQEFVPYFVQPPPAIVIIEPPIVQQPILHSTWPYNGRPFYQHIVQDFDLTSLEPGNYFTVIERDTICNVLGGFGNGFILNPVIPGRITPNSRQTTSWRINSPGHYEIFAKGSGRRLRLGCVELDVGNLVRFIKSSQGFDERHVIKPHPYEPGKMIIREEPLPQPYSTTPWRSNPDGSFENSS